MCIQKTDRILSIGCGVGLMEMEMIHQGYTRVEVTEISSEPLVWLKNLLPSDRIHVGPFPSVIPHGSYYDWILMSIVDYFFDQKAFPPFLSEACHLLSQSGRCTLVCFPSDEKQSLLDRLKYCIRNRCPQLERFGLLKPAQFWGYSRTLDEFHQAIEQAGLLLIEESGIDTQTRWSSHQLTLKRPSQDI